MPIRSIWLVSIFATAAACSTSLGEGHGQTRRSLSKATEHHAHPAVGMLLIDVEGNTARGGICTTTLVGQRTLLTAAHCLKRPGLYKLRLASKNYDIGSVTPNPGWDSGYVHDIGLAILSSPLPVPIAPALVSTKGGQKGQAVTLIGFGKTEGGKGEGTKRSGTNAISRVRNNSTFTTPPSGAGTCEGDSGGPVLASIDGKERVIGVISSLVGGGCGKGSSEHVMVSGYLDFLQSAAGGDLNTNGGVKPVLDASVPTGADHGPGGQPEAGAGEASIHADSSPARGDERAFGVACTADEQCRSSMCRVEPFGQRMYCTRACVANTDTCDGGDCLSSAGEFYCSPPRSRPPIDEGCQLGGVRRRAESALPFPLLLAVLVLLRRRREA